MKIKEEIKQSEFNDVFLQAFINVLFTGNFLRNKQQNTLKPYGITMQQFNILKILNGKHPEAMKAGEIKMVMIDKSPDLTRLINRMITNKWVKRNRSKSSGREVAISITKNGTELVNNVYPIALRDVEFLKNLSDLEAEQLSVLLDKVRGDSN